MFPFVKVFLCVLVVLRVWYSMEPRDVKITKALTNGSESYLMHLWHHFIDNYGIPFGQHLVSFCYSIYLWCTLFNVTIFIVKYVPTGLYMYKFLRNVYITSRERIKEKQLELEDIRLQIQIVNTKLCVRDAEFTERAEQLRRDADRLRKVRAKVRNLIATDESLRSALNNFAPCENVDIDAHTSPEQDRQLIAELLKGLKHEKVECREFGQSEVHASEDSVYSSLSDVDLKQDCHVKIVKVTNVYRVAYLKHFIKQRRLRRAHKHALLKKRVESIKNMLEEWQKSLNMVISHKLSCLNLESRIDAASQEAMGDYSKPTLREFSDSDSDLRNSCEDVTHDDYDLSWTQNNFRSCGYNYEDVQKPGEEFGDVMYPIRTMDPCECDQRISHKLCVLPEETNSQLAIEKMRSDEDYQAQPQTVV